MATRPHFRDDAFVIRSYKLGEADLILVLLTAEHGVQRVVAKGIRKSKSRFGAHLDRFSRVNVQIYPSRTLGRITDAQIVNFYATPIIADVDSYYAASAILELAVAVSHEPDISARLFELVDEALAELARGAGQLNEGQPDESLPPRVYADWFFIQALGFAGWAPSLVDCAQCGRPGPHKAFNAVAGGAVCVVCRPPGSATPPAQAVRFLWLLQQGRISAAAEAHVEDSTKSIARIAHDLLLSHARRQLEVSMPAYSTL